MERDSLRIHSARVRIEEGGMSPLFNLEGVDMKIYQIVYIIKDSVWSPGKEFQYLVAANNEDEAKMLHSDSLFGRCTELQRIIDTGKERDCGQIGYLV